MHSPVSGIIAERKTLVSVSGTVNVPFHWASHRCHPDEVRCRPLMFGGHHIGLSALSQFGLSVGSSDWVLGKWRSWPPEPHFTPHFSAIVMEGTVSGQLRVVKLWSGVRKGMLPVKYFHSNRSSFCVS